MAAWSRPFESTDAAEGGCPDAPCTLWKSFAQQGHWYCDAAEAATPWSIDLTSSYGPSCTHAPANFCCFAPLGYDGGPPFGSPRSKVCATLRRSGSDTSYCGASDHSAYGVRVEAKP